MPLKVIANHIIDLLGNIGCHVDVHVLDVPDSPYNIPCWIDFENGGETIMEVGLNDSCALIFVIDDSDYHCLRSILQYSDPKFFDILVEFIRLEVDKSRKVFK